MSIPTVSLAIIPMMTERAAVASAGFWIFGESLVALETPTASIEVTRPQEIELYARMFEHLKAAALIIKTLSELSLLFNLCVRLVFPSFSEVTGAGELRDSWCGGMAARGLICR